MRSNLFVFILWLVSLPHHRAHGADLPAENRTATLGSIDRISLDPEWKLEAGDKSVLSIEAPTDNQKKWKIMPIKTGRSIVFATDAAGNSVPRFYYNVISNTLEDQSKIIQTLLSDVPGVRVDAIDNQIVIRGKPERPEDNEKVLQVQAAYVDQVLNLAVDSQRLCETRICRHLNPEAQIDPPLLEMFGGANQFGCEPSDPICETVRRAIKKNLRKKNSGLKNRP